MKATFNEVVYYNGRTQQLGQKTVTLPFQRISARAIIIRRGDGALLGVCHQPGRKMALPGGGVENGETPTQALARELHEEGISMIAPDEGWQERFGVDYYPGYKELNFWFVITVDDLEMAPNPEIHEWRWVAQHEDPWHPGMGGRILLLLQEYLPAYPPTNL